MKKYSFVVLAIATVVLLNVDPASAQRPQGPRAGLRSDRPAWRQSTQESEAETTTQQHQQQSAEQYGSMQKTTEKHDRQCAQQVRTKSRKNFANVFTPQWYAKHPTAWHHKKPGANMWAIVTEWPVLAEWLGVESSDPTEYQTAYEEETYYLDDQGMPTSRYIADVTELAARGQTDTTEINPNQWMPLGVFVLASPGSTDAPNRVFQFAVNKNGQIAGSCYDTSNGKPIPINGSFDKQNHRVAWTLGEDDETVMETKLGSFVESESTVSVHKDGKTRTMTMVRLEGPTTKSPAQTKPPRQQSNRPTK